MKTFTKHKLRWLVASCLVFCWPILMNANALNKDNATVILEQADGKQTDLLSDTTDCSAQVVVGVERDFVPVLRCQWFHAGIDTYAPPLFADIDGDGQTEVVATLQNSPDGFVILDPTTCEPQQIVEVGGEVWLKDGGPVLGDVDRNGYVDIFIEVNTAIQRWQFNPEAGKVEKVWETREGVATAARSHLDIWDMNQDGQPELIPNIGQMVNAVTGYIYPGTLPYLNWEAKGLFAFTADALPGEAPAGQGNVELIYGTHIYRYDFINEEWLLIKKHPDFDWGFVANVSIADMDLDGDVDAVITRWNPVGEAVIWDLQTDELLGGGLYDYPGPKGSRINIANMDEDEYPEMVMTSEYRIFAIDDIVTTGKFGEIIWLDITSDQSGHTQMTSFDFDGNGTYEVVYRDENRVRIFSGVGTGDTDGYYPSSPRVLLDSGDEELCISFTGMEYPTIGDIDGDDHAEIIATCHNYVKVYESGSLPWADATAVWNTQAFNVTNVNQDGTIPAVQNENYKVYNNFLAQVSNDEPFDTVSFRTPDAFIQMNEIVNQCDGTFKVHIEVCNQGEAFLPKNTPVAFYWGTPGADQSEFVQTIKIYDALQPGECLPLTSNHIVAPQGDKELFAVVNDAGEGVLATRSTEGDDKKGDHPQTNIYECDYLNNLSQKVVHIDPVQVDHLNAQICDGETYAYKGNEFSQPGFYEFNVSVEGQVCDRLVKLTIETTPSIEVYEEMTICEGESVTIGGNIYTSEGRFTTTTTSANGCDSTIVIDLHVLESINIEHEATICEGEVYEYAGKTYKEAGTFTESFSNESGCDSLVVFTLSILSKEEEKVEAVICEGESYEFDGEILTESGYYEMNTASSEDCGKVTSLQLTVLPTEQEEINVEICEGESYEFAGKKLTTSGTYEEVLLGATGCDSLIRLNLEVRPVPLYEENVTICTGERYLFRGEFYEEPGIYELPFTDENGCEGTASLNLQVVTQIENSFEAKICEGETYEFGESIYLASGTYTETYTAANGCDSVVTLELEVLPEIVEQYSAVICEGETYEFRGKTYKEAGTYTERITNSNSCDNVIEFTLEVGIPKTIDLQQQICEGEVFTLGNKTYKESGTYVEHLTATNGCDSIVRLSLEVGSSIMSNQEVTICAGESYFFDGEYYDESGVYTSSQNASSGCDSVVQLSLTVLKPEVHTVEKFLCEGEKLLIGEEYKEVETGVYPCTFTSSSGCDSLVEYIVEVMPRSDIWGTDLAMCRGEEVQLEVFGGEEQYNWYPEHGLSCTDCPNPMASPSSTITYTVTTTGCGGEEVATEITVEVFDVPSLLVDDNVTIAPGESVELSANGSIGFHEINWETYSRPICDNCSSIEVSPTEDTKYIASIITDDGCIVQEEVEVRVRIDCVQDNFFIPNMFSPNGDGVNDFFYVETMSDVKLNFLRIYNRWGEMVFTTDDYDQHWDGTHQGRVLNPGVYVYYLEVYCTENQTYQKFGNVTIIK